MSTELTLKTQPFLEEAGSSLESEHISRLAESCPFQIRFGCAPALVKGCFNFSRINYQIEQPEIMDNVYDREWDGSPPEKVGSYLRRFYKDVQYHENLDLAQSGALLSFNRLLLVLWRDCLLDSDFSKEEGHWSFLVQAGISRVKICDPSNARRLYYKDDSAVIGIPKALNGLKFERRKVYELDSGYYRKNWKRCGRKH